MNHCREKARHLLLLNMQWVTGAPMNICAQAEAARERPADLGPVSLTAPTLAAGATATGATAREWEDKPRLRGAALARRPHSSRTARTLPFAPHAPAPSPPARICVFCLFVLLCKTHCKQANSK
jgi:hypothetical protein